MPSGVPERDKFLFFVFEAFRQSARFPADSAGDRQEVNRGAFLRLLRAQRELILGVHIEDADRCPAGRRLANHVDAAPGKVIFPTLLSRMEKFRDVIRLRINTRQVRAFVEITVDASQRQIVEIIAASMGSRKDMLDMKRGQRGILLVKLAVLAAIAGALPDAGFRSLIHRSGF